MPTSHHHSHGDLQGHVAWRPVHAAGSGHEPDTRFGQAEACVFSRNDDVAGEGDLETTTQCETVNCCYDRLVYVITCGDPCKAAPPLRHRLTTMGGGVFQIIASRKCFIPRTGDDGDPHLLVSDKIIPNRVHFDVTRRMHSIEHFRPVEGYIGQVFFLFVAHEFEVHFRHTSRTYSSNRTNRFAS